MSIGVGVLGTFTAIFLWIFIPPCNKGLDFLYMLSSLTESLAVSGLLLIIPSSIYALKLDDTGQYKYCHNSWISLVPSTSESVKIVSFISQWIKKSGGY